MALTQDRQAGAIELTPEMVDAGVEVLMDFDWGWTKPSDCVMRVFRSMLVVSPFFVVSQSEQSGVPPVR